MLMRTVRQQVDDWVHGWAVQSQSQARRNAMVAATILARRSAEAREVNEFLEARNRAAGVGVDRQIAQQA
jgi:hypothetical protein